MGLSGCRSHTQQRPAVRRRRMPRRTGSATAASNSQASAMDGSSVVDTTTVEACTCWSSTPRDEGPIPRRTPPPIAPSRAAPAADDSAGKCRVFSSEPLRTGWSVLLAVAPRALPGLTRRELDSGADGVGESHWLVDGQAALDHVDRARLDELPLHRVLGLFGRRSHEGAEGREVDVVPEHLGGCR